MCATSSLAFPKPSAGLVNDIWPDGGGRKGHWAAVLGHDADVWRALRRILETVAGAALQACPAPGTSFTDTFGAPRSGGRTHKGVDMMGPAGSPVYAAQSGSVSHSSSSLGGNQAYVHGNSGDVTFYAHLQGYAGGPRQVSAGEHIGYIGDTGNAQGSPHLHFEYHPGGGGAVNPYPYVKAVCG